MRARPEAEKVTTAVLKLMARTLDGKLGCSVIDPFLTSDFGDKKVVIMVSRA